MEINMTMPNGNIRHIGNIVDNKLFLTKKPEHFMVKYKGFGLSVRVIAILLEMQIKDIVITYIGTRGIVRYLTTTQAFIDSELEHDFQDDGGSDRQKFVPIQTMKLI
jgi:hypothetical protein